MQMISAFPFARLKLTLLTFSSMTSPSLASLYLKNDLNDTASLLNEGPNCQS